MARSSDWPLAEGVRIPARTTQARRRPLPRTAWMLAAAAFVCGAAVSAAGFSIGWRHQAQRNSSAEAALAAATAKTHSLADSLASTRADLARARSAAAAEAASARRVSREASALATALVATGHAADSVSLGGAAVGTRVDRLASELKTLTTYLTTTPASQLDTGYVATQTAYLSKQLAQLQGASSDLAAAIADFDTGAKALTARATSLAGRN